MSLVLARQPLFAEICHTNLARHLTGTPVGALAFDFTEKRPHLSHIGAGQLSSGLRSQKRRRERPANSSHLNCRDV